MKLLGEILKLPVGDGEKEELIKGQDHETPSNCMTNNMSNVLERNDNSLSEESCQNLEPSTKKPRSDALLMTKGHSSHGGQVAASSSESEGSPDGNLYRICQFLQEIMTEESWELKDSVIETMHNLLLEKSGTG